MTKSEKYGIMEAMKIGDKVKIINSPYWSVKNGTIGTIVDIRFEEYGNRWAIYILDTKPCQIFRIQEIKPIEKNHENNRLF